MVAIPTVPAEHVTSRRRKSTARLARVEIRRRLWDLGEVTEILNRGAASDKRPRYSIETIRGWVARGELPIIYLPSAWAVDRERPGWRTYRVPDVWIADWFAMCDQHDPIITERSDLGAPDDPPWLSVADTALAIGVSHATMYEILKLGILASHVEPSGKTVISTRRLDDWVFGMIQDAEQRWYAADKKGAVSA